MTTKQLHMKNTAAVDVAGIRAGGFRTRVRRLVPDAPREFACSVLQRVLGSHWTSIGFRHIDHTPLRALSKSKVFEPELKLLPFFISKPGIVFDVGANIGEYTYVLEKTVGP